MSNGREMAPQSVRFVHGAAPTLPLAVSRALGLPVMAPVPGPGSGDDPPHASVEEVADALTEEAVWRLDAVLADPGAGRDVAFRLLAADALLTWSCEAAADGADPGEILGSLAKRVAARET
jgi:hypothetical protein